MRSPSDGFLGFLSRLCGVLGFGALAVVTLSDNGATRMYAWPWWAAWWGVQIAPVGMLTFRVLARPLALPPPSWRWALTATAVVVFLSSAFSPYRAESFWYAAMPLAGLAVFLLVYDWLQSDSARHGAVFITFAAWSSVILVGTSLVGMCSDLIPKLETHVFLATLPGYRNLHPLGHPNYSAGLGLITLPWLVAKTRRSVGKFQLLWGLTSILSLLVIFTSASRGGFIGLVALTLFGLGSIGLARNRLAGVVAAACVALLLLALASPRVRASFVRSDPKAAPYPSSVQRSAMFKAGLHMVQNRPILGWGLGTTPLVYPRYRGELDGGVETALHLHSTPTQFGAELGLGGLLCGLCVCGLIARDGLSQLGQAKPADNESKNSEQPGSNPARAIAAATLFGYGVFSLTDYQLDVPLFASAAAFCAAAVAGAVRKVETTAGGRFFSLTLVGLFAIALSLGRRDPTPPLNVSALLAAGHPEKMAEAIRVLEDSLQINPDQEIAHFNLAWMLLEKDPAAAEQHFLAAAHLVPDKGNVYLGLALARAKLGKSEKAARAFALECLNDPIFLTSPWWSIPEIASYRAATASYFSSFLTQLSLHLPPDRWPGSEARYTEALFDWLWSDGRGEKVMSASTTEERRAYFSRHERPPAFESAGIKSFRRERPGYPIVMRNLDLATPVDFFEIHEKVLASDKLGFLFPQKGWLPSPLLVALLDEMSFPKN